MRTNGLQYMGTDKSKAPPMKNKRKKILFYYVISCRIFRKLVKPCKVQKSLVRIYSPYHMILKGNSIHHFWFLCKLLHQFFDFLLPPFYLMKHSTCFNLPKKLLLCVLCSLMDDWDIPSFLKHLFRFNFNHIGYKFDWIFEIKYAP